MIVVEGVSKRYPRTPVTIFPPVVSMFDRNWFSRRRSSSDAEAGSAEAEAVSTDPETRTAGGGAPAPRSPARRRDRDLEDDFDDDDDLEDDDDLDDGEPSARPGGPTPGNPGEMFWALRDVSFRVPRGAALGVLGGPDAGKSTLLRILGGQSFPTEGRVLVHDRVSPLHEPLARALSLTGKGTHKLSLTMGARLLGIEGHLVKQHQDEIEELAQPAMNASGEPEAGTLVRLAVAMVVVLPTSLILLDELKGVDETFIERIIERLRQRLRRGSSLVAASRLPGPIQELCDEVILLDGGTIVDRRDAADAVEHYKAAQDGSGENATGERSAGGRKSGTIAPGRHLSQGLRLHVPPAVPAFNASAALLSATLHTATGRKRIDAGAEEASVKIHLETALPDIEVQCGVSFTPRGGEGPGIRLELPEPLRFVRPGAYVVVARAMPGALPGDGVYQARADAVVANPAERRASVIARDVSSVRIVGNELDAAEPAEPPVAHWDGQILWRAEADWSIE